MYRTLGLMTASVLLLLAACNRGAQAGSGAAPAGPPAAAGTGNEACDSRATTIEPDRSYNLQIEATGDPYPANCLYYCLALQAGTSELDIDVRDFNTDLDLFVGFGEFESVIGEVPVEGETYTWKSNRAGMDDEQVRLVDAEPGLYYIEVCSYRGDSTTFELATEVR